MSPGDPALAISDNISGHDNPLIVTLRSVEQGGHSAVNYETRRRFWSVLAAPASDSLFDLEHDLVQDFSARDQSGGLQADWEQIICSHHDFSGVPKDLSEIYEAMAATPAGIIKIGNNDSCSWAVARIVFHVRFAG